MKNTEFNSYIKNYINNLRNVNDKAKVNYFIDYINEYSRVSLGIDFLDTPDIFDIIDKQFLLDCINAYIDERNPVKGVAEDFKRTIFSLSKDICRQYEIANSFFENAYEQEEFHRITKDWFESLKATENRECITTEGYELLEEAIRDFFEITNLEEKIVDSLNESKGKYDYYRQLVSAIAIKLIQKYGLSNKAIANLKLSDLDMDSKTITVNGFNLKLTDDLISIFTLYLRCRNIVCNKNNRYSEKLFVTRDGTSYLNKNGDSENGKLFAIMEDIKKHTIKKDTIKNLTPTGLRYKTIIDLVARGANIFLLYQLTEVRTVTIAKLCIADKEDLENVFKHVNDSSIIEKSKIGKGFIRCPFCGCYKEATSDNWILIQNSKEDKKKIACRDCRGLDGKYRY